jgi:pimeloyl-ACP methyl ester carboxylesterase
MDLNHEASGDSSRPALLLIHPLGADLHFWDSCSAHWRDTFYCIACDLPSAGTSPRPAQPATVADQTDALQRLCERLCVEPAIVVGTAVGGMPAIEFVARRPQRVGALVVTNPGIRIPPGARASLSDRIAKLEAGGMPAILPDAVDKPFNGLPHDETYHSYLSRFSEQDPLRYASAIRGILDADVRGALGLLKCPTLVVCAEHEALMDPADADAIVGAVPGSRKVVMERASHFLLFQVPDRFADVVRDFA